MVLMPRRDNVKKGEIEALQAEVIRLRRALQRVADLPPPHALKKPLKRSPRRIAIVALRKDGRPHVYRGLK